MEKELNYLSELIEETDQELDLCKEGLMLSQRTLQDLMNLNEEKQLLENILSALTLVELNVKELPVMDEQEVLRLAKMEAAAIPMVNKPSDLERLNEWLLTKNREPANTKFTAGDLRNVANEIEYQIK